ncbi:zinc finger domain-containing protein [Streptomyces bauhiniae]|uniref:zinc finger domain-containing protein n=1 Tax=Streptomyces bauhiniae TaxID=2340725 RepID=UPI003F4CAC3C
MPASLRATLRTPAHPARGTACPHCHAQPGKPCTLRKSGRLLTSLHPDRISVWAIATAVCPACQVAPGTPCHDNGQRLPIVHARRTAEAEETAA